MMLAEEAVHTGRSGIAIIPREVAETLQLVSEDGTYYVCATLHTLLVKLNSLRDIDQES